MLYNLHNARTADAVSRLMSAVGRARPDISTPTSLLTGASPTPPPALWGGAGTWTSSTGSIAVRLTTLIRKPLGLLMVQVGLLEVVLGTLGGMGAGKEGSDRTGMLPKKAQKDVYVKAPMDAAVAQHACPICQEEFRTVWHDGAQEWVWMDALSVVGKVYHKSCLDELAKDRGGSVRGVKKEAA